MTQWINIDSKLPKLKERVLVFSCRDIYVAWISYFDKENKPDWQYSDCCGCSVDGVTHWAKLPEYPK